MDNEFESKVLNYKRYLETNQDGEKIPRIFNKLLEMPITVNILQNTGIGKVVNGFRKREGDVGRKAKIIVSTWKDLVAQEQLRLEAENEVLETGNENYSNDCSPVSEEDRQLSENDAGSVKSDYSNEDYNVPKNFSDKENLNRSKKHDHSHGKRENNSRHSDQDHSHDKKDKRHRHEEKKDKHKERTEKIKSSHSERQKNPNDKYGEKCADDGKFDSDSNRLERKNSESHSDSEKTKNNKPEYKNKEHSGSEHGKYTSKSEHRKNSDSEHGRSSKSEHKKDSKSEHGKYSSKSEHRKDSDSEHGKSSKSEHKKDSKSEHGKYSSKSEHRKDSDSEHGKSSKSEHKKDSKSEHGKVSKSEHGKNSKSEHGKDSKSEHGKDSKSEHRQDSKSENGKYSTSEQNKHSSRDTHISSSGNKNHSNSENKKHSDSEYRKHSDSEHRKHSDNESSRKSDKKHDSSKYSNSDTTGKSESRNKHSSSKHEHKSRSEHKYDDKKKKNGDHRAESDANVDTKSDFEDKTENFKSEKYQKHESRSDRKEIHSTNVEEEMESLDSELNGFDGHNHITFPTEDRNIFDRLVNGKTDEKPIKKTDEVQSSHVTHKGDSKSKSEGSSSRSHSSSSRSHSSHKVKESSSKSHHSIKKEDEKKAESLSEKSNSRHSAEEKDGSRSKHKESSRSSKHGSSKDKSRSHKSDEKSKSKHSDDKSRHSSKSEKSSHKTKHSSSKDKKEKEPAVEFLAFNESGVTKKRDVDYEQLKSKFKIKKKGEPSQKLLAPSKDFPVKKRKNEEQDSPVASKMAKIDKSALYEELYNLPAPQTHYRPWRYSQLEDKKSSADEFSDEGNFWTKNTTRTAVYSGRKQQYVPKMYSLYEICLQSLMNNIDGLDYVGGVPFDIMKPILEKCTPAQLYRLEDCNPFADLMMGKESEPKKFADLMMGKESELPKKVFLEDTDYLWKRRCDKEFKNTEPDEFESWREMYWRKSDEREEKLLSLRSTITQSMAQKLPVKTTKLAYVDSAAKPPRDVRRQQIKFGTAGPSSGERMKKFSHLMEPVAISRPTQMKRVAPMMQKTLTMMKKIRR